MSIGLHAIGMAAAHVATICSIAHDSSGRGAGRSLRDPLQASDYASRGSYSLERDQGWTVGSLGPNAARTDERHYSCRGATCTLDREQPMPPINEKSASN